MMREYYRQPVTWKKKTGSNGYGEAILDQGKEIKVRWEGIRKLVRNSQGQEVVSQIEVRCSEAIGNNDTINIDGVDYPVIAVSVTPSIDARLVERVVSL